MSLTARDRKILAVLVLLATIAAYWFLLLGPKRDEAREAGEQLAEQEERRDTALASLAELEAAKNGFRADYATVVRLGKAIPTEVDMPGLLVQLQEAARGTGISFDSVSAGDRAAAPAPTTAPPASDTAAAGAAAPPPAPAGQTAEEAGEAALAAGATGTGTTATADPAASGGTAAPSETTASTGTTTSTGAPAAPAGTAATPGSAAPGLESVPLDFVFQGSFFELADFFHEMKRFVHVANDRIEVQGRLMTLDSVSLTSAEDSFPNLTAEVSATVYVAPETQGTTAGATPAGPAPATPPATEPAPATASGSPAAPPTATATP